MLHRTYYVHVCKIFFVQNIILILGIEMTSRSEKIQNEGEQHTLYLSPVHTLQVPLDQHVVASSWLVGAHKIARSTFLAF